LAIKIHPGFRNIEHLQIVPVTPQWNVIQLGLLFRQRAGLTGQIQGYGQCSCS
jgi:hypothetical protein